MTVRFCNGTFQDELPTVGASYYTKSYILPGGQNIKIEVYIIFCVFIKYIY